MSIASKIATRLLKQTQKPTGRLGRFLARSMNISHSRLTNWGLEQISIERHATTLDVGCGGGWTVRKLAEITTGGTVCGIDYSEESVAIARSTNRQLIDAGHVEIRHGSVSHLPYPDRTFDLVTAVETHYFWPDLVADMREVLRVLKPGGKLMILGEVYRGGKHYDWTRRLIGSAEREVKMDFPGVDEISELFARAGYAEVQIREDYHKGWIFGVGRRPA